MTNGNKAVIITWEAAIDIINMLTYDDYAYLKRQLTANGTNRRPTFDEYIQRIERSMFGVDMFDRDIWYSGYEVIADLFDANEANGDICDKWVNYKF